MSISALRAKAAKKRQDAESGGADEQELSPPDQVAERSHDEQRARSEKAVDIDDPQELGRARIELGAQRGHGEVQDREVHRIDDAGQRDDGKTEPFAACRLARLQVGGLRGCGHLGQRLIRGGEGMMLMRDVPAAFDLAQSDGQAEQEAAGLRARAAAHDRRGEGDILPAVIAISSMSKAWEGL